MTNNTKRVTNTKRATFKKTALGILAAVTASTSAAHAQADGAPGFANPSGIVANFDAANLGSVLSDLGVVWQERKTSEGRTYIAANIGGQLSIAFLPQACLKDGVANCVGLNTYAEFSDVAVNPQSISAFNQKYWFVSAGATSNNQGAFISRYDIADYGIARGNIKSSLENFIVLAIKLRDELKSGSRTVSLDGYADDLSASLLNRRGFEDIGGEIARTSIVDYHLNGFEETPEFVKIFVSDPSAPKNKIINVTQ